MELKAEDGRAAHGEDWNHLFLRFRPVAVRLARGIAGGAAEDIVHEAARAVLERVARGEVGFVSPDHARNYFLRAVHNRAVDALREPGQRTHGLAAPEQLASAGPAPHEPLQAVEEARVHSLALERLARALARLGPEEREAVRLRYMEGLSYREISARCGAAISTLHSRVEAALGKIRSDLGPEFGKELGPP